MDEHLGILKTGKESDVHLIARHGASGTTLLAEKRFRPRDRRGFTNDWTYTGVWGEGTRREFRAMRRKTRFGRQAIHAVWVAHEWEELVRLHAAGATVPEPVEPIDDGYRMAFIGKGIRAAPRLVDVDLDRATAERVWNVLLGEVAVFLAAERVHGDLSAYNVLWWRERPVVIDLSQTVDVVTHPAALDLLRRDVTALAAYFRRRGVDADIDRALRGLGADDVRFARQWRR
ncbi:MAG: phosphotransferase [Chloroflexota bacterium]|nr:phosphotransferase [Chloroflexota bacterium]